jgi:hypothetical protein
VAGLAKERERDAAERRRLRLRLGAAGLVVLAGLVGLGLLAGGRPVAPGRGRYDPGTSDPVAAAVPVLSGFVAATRGQPFHTPPAIASVDGATFRRLAAVRLAEPSGAGDVSATARALGFAPPPAVDVTRVRAFYDVAGRRVVVRRDLPLDAVARVSLVRELTHALQDQAFDLHALIEAAGGEPDRLRALSALVEGDAARVELAYLTTLSPADQAAVRRAGPAPGTDSYPANVRAFPDAFGRAFVAALVAHGGNAAVDAAFRHPPVSTAQVIDPRKYLAGVQPLGVRAPPAEGTPVDRGSLGEFGIAMLVTGGRRVLNASSASLWAGDSYVTFRSGGRQCTYDNVILTTADARDQLYGDLGTFAREPGVTVARSADRGVRIRSCR